MADSSAQDRNLPASQRKLQKAREEGQLPRSRDLGHFAALPWCVCGAQQLGRCPQQMAPPMGAMADRVYRLPLAPGLWVLRRFYCK